MHHGHLATWGLAPLGVLGGCIVLLAFLSRRLQAAADQRHPLTHLATDRFMRRRHGRGYGSVALRHLRHDPVLARQLRWIDRIKLVAFLAWLLFLAALA